MNNYFTLKYEFDRATVRKTIDDYVQAAKSGYICVADGVVLNMAMRDAEYNKVVNQSIFCVCDSSYVPLYIKWIYGKKYDQYSGTDLFKSVIANSQCKMAFLGSSQDLLDKLREKLIPINPAVKDMLFMELPYCPVEEFDYRSIASTVNAYGADIVWVSLGAPKQERFMSLLLPHLTKGVMIAVGAVFKFVSGVDSRAPGWMVRHHLEFVYRLTREPRKQFKRCAWIVLTLPGLLWGEWRRKHRALNKND